MDMRLILQKFWHFLKANAELARDVNQWRLKVPAADAEGGAERWITLSNGKRCKLDAEGNVTAGFKDFVGKNVSELGRPETELKPYSPPAKGYGKYLKAAQELGDKNAHVKAAKQFYKENLQNTYVTTTFGDLGEQDVLFTGKGGGKLTFDLDSKPLKAALIEDLPGILQGQNYAGSGPPKGKVDKHGKPKQREDYDRFHYFNATLVKAVDGKSKRVKVHVDVGQRNDSYEVNEVYHLSHDKKNVKAAGGSIAEAILAEVGCPQPLAGGLDVKESISQIFEFINLEIMEEGN